MATKKNNALTWLIAPKEVGTNRDTSLIKLVAMIAMVFDHAGKMFFPHYQVMRIIGRLAFPLFAYCIAVGCVYSRNRLKYLSRLLLIGLVSQPFYAKALAHTSQRMFAVRFVDNPIRAVVNFYMESWGTPNIMLTLAFGLLIIWCIRDRQFVCALAVMLLAWKLDSSINYGWKGLLLILLFYLTISRWWLSLPVMLGYMVWWGLQGSAYQLFGIRFGIQMFAVPALLLVYIPTYSKLKINKWVFYLFYPAHLIGIMLIQFAMAAG